MLFAEAIARAGSDAPAQRKWRRPLAWVLLVILGANVGTVWFAQNRLLATRPYAPLRDVAEYVQDLRKESSGAGPLIVCYGHGHEVMPLYLRDVKPAISRAELEKFMNQAKAEQRPLLVMQGHTVHNRALIPDGFELLDDRAVLEEVKAFAGIEPEFYFRVFRLK
jgi:hypothetical protein